MKFRTIEGVGEYDAGFSAAGDRDGEDCGA